ncbi:MAG: hypothetical protein EBY20_02600 [Alphaproteobacteria bacterium]|jgi:hypothetical protein|uniref:Uncharacterized protein n=1 Tax=viral metagenome TaxID=1070528 RepID=A0A6C0HRK3_9ZZZZ|nr:hypothetical protein [Alphaproteobacteria bacterium]
MSFDLNIENYKKGELEEIFNLKSGQYDSNAIEQKCAQLRDNVSSDKSIEQNVRMKTIIFLDEAKRVLASQLNSSNVVQKLANAYNMNPNLVDSGVIDAGNTFIIDKPKSAFANSYPGEFFPGVINPLKKRTTKQNLNIDTRFRENYYTSSSSNFHFDLPIKFSSVMQMQLAAFEMPFSYFNISKQRGNNFFSIKRESTGVNYVITIPDGNYTPESLVAYLNNYCTVTVTALNFVQFIYNIDGTGSGSGQLIVGVTTGNEGAYFTLNFQNDINGNPDTTNPLPLKLGWMLGFRNGIYSGNINYISEGLVDLTGSKYLYLVVDDYNNNVNNGFYSAFNSSVLNKNILARISTQPSPFGSTSQSNLSLITTPRQYFGPVDIQKLNIQLLDEYGRVIELNNMDYSFCLTFTSVYDI